MAKAYCGKPMMGKVSQDGRSKVQIKSGDCGGFGKAAKVPQQFEPTPGNPIRQHKKYAGA